MYDIIVVGGRTAGASTAMLLARRGRRVLLVDRPAVSDAGGCASLLSGVGLALLNRWGVLRTVRAGGCVEREAVTINGGGRTAHLVERSAVVRVPALDDALRQAARASGVEVRERFTVRDVVWRDGRVVGVVGSGDDQHAMCDEARVVVGADGRQSVVARAARAPVLRDEPSAACCYSACWRDADVASPQLHLGPAAMAALLPAADGVTCVRVAVPVEGWARYKRDPEATYLSALRSLGPADARLAGATRSGRFCGSADLAACVRQAEGPGWLLVGDAARHAGGILTRGVSHALVQAELAAAALDAALDAGAGGEGALGRYQTAVDELLRSAEDLTTALASWGRPMAAIDRLAAALSEAAASQAQRIDTLHSMGARGSGE